MTLKKKPIPISARRSLRKLGDNINVARRRRGISQDDMAQRCRISINTLKKLESGDPGVSIGTFATAMMVLGANEEVGQLLDQSMDEQGLLLDKAALPQRIRKKSR